VGAAGVNLLPEPFWENHPSIEALVDTNAVPPFGIGGIDPEDNHTNRHGKVTYGATGVGALKIAIHCACVARLFDRNDQVLDIAEIYEIGKTLL